MDKIWLLEEENIKEYPYSYDKFADVYGDNMAARKHLWEVQEKERRRLEAMVKEFKRKTAIHLKNLNKFYDKDQILKDLSLHVFCGEKIAINAPNGSGKSTLLNVISGRLEYNSGEVYLGPNLKVGTYTQEHLNSLDENATLAEELQKTGQLEWFRGIGYLKRFMFTDSQINSAVKYLSGGQKSRLQLAKFLVTNPDVLILDEPTNHLDLKTVIALEKFLMEYPGTLILVSHDRELVEKVVDKIYLLNDGQLQG